MKEYNRKDNRYLDFEDITEGSIVLVECDYEHNKYGMWTEQKSNNYPFICFAKGDIWIVEGLANRPRVAIIRNLQRNERSGIRVDALLELDDKEIVTVGPGPDRAQRDD